MNRTVRSTDRLVLDKGNFVVATALVGSRAHGLHTESSDWDWRGVYVAPTSRLLSLGVTVKQNKWIEGEVDDTSYEIGKFLFLATKSNPSILEIFASPEYSILSPIGEKMLELFPHVWSAKGVRDAFKGYSKNQQKKFLDDNTPDERRWKYAVAYLRVLQLGIDLLGTGKMNMCIKGTSFADDLFFIKRGYWSVGEVLDEARQLSVMIDKAYEDQKGKTTNMEAVNEFLLDVRKNNW